MKYENTKLEIIVHSDNDNKTLKINRVNELHNEIIKNMFYRMLKNKIINEQVCEEVYRELDRLQIVYNNLNNENKKLCQVNIDLKVKCEDDSKVQIIKLNRALLEETDTKIKITNKLVKIWDLLYFIKSNEKSFIKKK